MLCWTPKVGCCFGGLFFFSPASGSLLNPLVVLFQPLQHMQPFAFKTIDTCLPIGKEGRSVSIGLDASCTAAIANAQGF